MEASGVNQWKIGDVKITRVVESEGPWDGTMILPNGTAENVQKESDWLYPIFTDENGKLRMAIQALVIESQGKRIIVDTCIGNDKVRSNPEWNKQQLPFLQDLQKIGSPRETIDSVICTHLHIDHVGWNTMLKAGKWVPTFPNAKYLIGGTEWDFFSRAADPFLKDPVDDSVLPVMGEGMSELVDDGYRITDEVWLESTPGHTPGHFAVRIASKGQNGVITGDLMHHPIQMPLSRVG
jgi:glyoxylase-like metal-dependent hydrolase (beta-lactamase superfamily II)